LHILPPLLFGADVGTVLMFLSLNRFFVSQSSFFLSLSLVCLLVWEMIKSPAKNFY